MQIQNINTNILNKKNLHSQKKHILQRPAFSRSNFHNQTFLSLPELPTELFSSFEFFGIKPYFAKQSDFIGNLCSMFFNPEKVGLRSLKDQTGRDKENSHRRSFISNFINSTFVDRGIFVVCVVDDWDNIGSSIIKLEQAKLAKKSMNGNWPIYFVTVNEKSVKQPYKSIYRKLLEEYSADSQIKILTTEMLDSKHPYSKQFQDEMSSIRFATAIIPDLPTEGPFSVGSLTRLSPNTLWSSLQPDHHTYAPGNLSRANHFSRHNSHLISNDSELSQEFVELYDMLLHNRFLMKSIEQLTSRVHKLPLQVIFNSAERYPACVFAGLELASFMRGDTNFGNHTINSLLEHGINFGLLQSSCNLGIATDAALTHRIGLAGEALFGSLKKAAEYIHTNSALGFIQALFPEANSLQENSRFVFSFPESPNIVTEKSLKENSVTVASAGLVAESIRNLAIIELQPNDGALYFSLLKSYNKIPLQSLNDLLALPEALLGIINEHSNNNNKVHHVSSSEFESIKLGIYTSLKDFLKRLGFNKNECISLAKSGEEIHITELINNLRDEIILSGQYERISQELTNEKIYDFIQEICKNPSLAKRIEEIALEKIFTEFRVPKQSNEVTIKNAIESPSSIQNIQVDIDNVRLSVFYIEPESPLHKALIQASKSMSDENLIKRLLGSTLERFNMEKIKEDISSAAVAIFPCPTNQFIEIVSIRTLDVPAEYIKQILQTNHFHKRPVCYNNIGAHDSMGAGIASRDKTPNSFLDFEEVYLSLPKEKQKDILIKLFNSFVRAKLINLKSLLRIIEGKEDVLESEKIRVENLINIFKNYVTSEVAELNELIMMVHKKEHLDNIDLTPNAIFEKIKVNLFIDLAAKNKISTALLISVMNAKEKVTSFLEQKQANEVQNTSRQEEAMHNAFSAAINAVILAAENNPADLKFLLRDPEFNQIWSMLRTESIRKHLEVVSTIRRNSKLRESQMHEI